MKRRKEISKKYFTFCFLAVLLVLFFISTDHICISDFDVLEDAKAQEGLSESQQIERLLDEALSRARHGHLEASNALLQIVKEHSEYGIEDSVAGKLSEVESEIEKVRAMVPDSEAGANALIDEAKDAVERYDFETADFKLNLVIASDVLTYFPELYVEIQEVAEERENLRRTMAPQKEEAQEFLRRAEEAIDAEKPELAQEYISRTAELEVFRADGELREWAELLALEAEELEVELSAVSEKREREELKRYADARVEKIQDEINARNFHNAAVLLDELRNSEAYELEIDDIVDVVEMLDKQLIEARNLWENQLQTVADLIDEAEELIESYKLDEARGILETVKNKDIYEDVPELQHSVDVLQKMLEERHEHFYEERRVALELLEAAEQRILEYDFESARDLLADVENSAVFDTDEKVAAEFERLSEKHEHLKEDLENREEHLMQLLAEAEDAIQEQDFEAAEQIITDVEYSDEYDLLPAVQENWRSVSEKLQTEMAYWHDVEAERDRIHSLLDDLNDYIESYQFDYASDVIEEINASPALAHYEELQTRLDKAESKLEDAHSEYMAAIEELEHLMEEAGNALGNWHFAKVRDILREIHKMEVDHLPEAWQSKLDNFELEFAAETLEAADRRAAVSNKLAELRNAIRQWEFEQAERILDSLSDDDIVFAFPALKRQLSLLEKEYAESIEEAEARIAEAEDMPLDVPELPDEDDLIQEDPPDVDEQRVIAEAEQTLERVYTVKTMEDYETILSDLRNSKKQLQQLEVEPDREVDDLISDIGDALHYVNFRLNDYYAFFDLLEESANMAEQLFFDDAVEILDMAIEFSDDQYLAFESAPDIELPYYGELSESVIDDIASAKDKWSKLYNSVLTVQTQFDNIRRFINEEDFDSAESELEKVFDQPAYEKIENLKTRTQEIQTELETAKEKIAIDRLAQRAQELFEEFNSQVSNLKYAEAEATLKAIEKSEAYQELDWVEGEFSRAEQTLSKTREAQQMWHDAITAYEEGDYPEVVSNVQNFKDVNIHVDPKLDSEASQLALVSEAVMEMYSNIFAEAETLKEDGEYEGAEELFQEIVDAGIKLRDELEVLAEERLESVRALIAERDEGKLRTARQEQKQKILESVDAALEKTQAAKTREQYRAALEVLNKAHEQLKEFNPQNGNDVETRLEELRKMTRYVESQLAAFDEIDDLLAQAAEYVHKGELSSAEESLDAALSLADDKELELEEAQLSLKQDVISAVNEAYIAENPDARQYHLAILEQLQKHHSANNFHIARELYNILDGHGDMRLFTIQEIHTLDDIEQDVVQFEDTVATHSETLNDLFMETEQLVEDGKGLQALKKYQDMLSYIEQSKLPAARRIEFLQNFLEVARELPKALAEKALELDEDPEKFIERIPGEDVLIEEIAALRREKMIHNNYVLTARHYLEGDVDVAGEYAAQTLRHIDEDFTIERLFAENVVYEKYIPVVQQEINAGKFEPALEKLSTLMDTTIYSEEADVKDKVDKLMAEAVLERDIALARAYIDEAEQLYQVDEIGEARRRMESLRDLDSYELFPDDIRSEAAVLDSNIALREKALILRKQAYNDIMIMLDAAERKFEKGDFESAIVLLDDARSMKEYMPEAYRPEERVAEISALVEDYKRFKKEAVDTAYGILDEAHELFEDGYLERADDKISELREHEAYALSSDLQQEVEELSRRIAAVPEPDFDLDGDELVALIGMVESAAQAEEKLLALLDEIEELLETNELDESAQRLDEIEDLDAAHEISSVNNKMKDLRQDYQWRRAREEAESIYAEIDNYIDGRRYLKARKKVVDATESRFFDKFADFRDTIKHYEEVLSEVENDAQTLYETAVEAYREDDMDRLAELLEELKSKYRNTQFYLEHL